MRRVQVFGVEHISRQLRRVDGNTNCRWRQARADIAKHMFITASDCPEHFAGDLVRLFFQEAETSASAGEAVGEVHNFHHKAGCGL